MVLSKGFWLTAGLIFAPALTAGYTSSVVWGKTSFDKTLIFIMVSIFTFLAVPLSFYLMLQFFPGTSISVNDIVAVGFLLMWPLAYRVTHTNRIIIESLDYVALDVKADV